MVDEIVCNFVKIVFAVIFDIAQIGCTMVDESLES